MGRGLILGLLTGFLVSAAGLSVASLMAPPVDGAVRMAMVTEPAEAPAPAVAEPAPVPAEEPAPAVTPEPAPEPEVAAAPEPAPEPVAEAAPEPMTEPAAEAETPAMAAESGAQPETHVVEAPAGSEFTRERPDEEPVVPVAEVAPESMDAPAVIEPATEAAPELAEVTPPAAPESPVTSPEAIPAPEPVTPDVVAMAPAAEDSVPVPPPGEAVAPALDESVAPDAPAEVAPETPAPVAEEVAEPEPAPAEERVAQAEPEVLPEPGTVPESASPDTDEVAEAAPKPLIIGVGNQPRLGSEAGPQPGFSAAVPGVKINRLPSIGEPEAEAAAQEPETGTIGAGGDLPAVQRYAVPVSNPDGLPVLGVVLIDPAEGGLPAATIAGIGQPVTVAVDPTRADAAERGEALRAAGLEVAILVPDLPDGATAADLEVSYQAFTQALPEAVAVIGAPDARYQSDRRVAQHMVSLLSSEGRGLVTYDRGLNPARQAADSKDLPNAIVYRELDARGESRLTMRRYLDRAAFEAAQTGRILVVGSASEEVVAALRDWVQSGAKGTLTAPLTSVMLTAE